MKKVYIILTSMLFLSMFVMPLSFYGQDQKTDDTKKEKKSSGFSGYLFITGDIGPSWWHGDLARYGSAPDFANTSINGSLGFGWQFLSWLNVYVKANRAFAKGEQEHILPKNNIGLGAGVHQDMKTDVDMFGGDIHLGINLMNMLGGYKERLFSISLHGGVGQRHYKSRTYDLNTDKRLATSGYKDEPSYAGSGHGFNDRNVELIVPFGAELTFAVAEKWDVYGDYTYTWMSSDWVDNVSHGEMAFINDAYSQFNLGLRYKFRSNKIKKMAENFEDVQLEATPNPLEEIGDSVEVTIKGTFPPKYFAKDAVMCFTPVLKYEGGETAYENINFIGEDVDCDGTMISYANGGTFTYTKKVAYDPAMENSELTVTPVVYKYDGECYATCEGASNQNKSYTADERKLDDGVIHTSRFVKDNALVAYTPHGYEKETISTVESAIFFQVNLSNYNKNLPLNKDADNKDALNNSIVDVEKGWVVKDISIDGWASPEGEETFNEGLSQRRAETAEKYMKNKINKAAKNNNKIDKDAADNIELILTANGPDWNGFMKAVETSDIKDKDAIINVINSADNSQKEAEIRNMILIYPELERDILPPLRRAVIDVNCYITKRPDEQIAEYSTAYPDSLSVNELLYAATLTDDLNTKKQIYSNAMNLNPDCWRAKVNAAVVEYRLGNIDEAKALLKEAQELNDNSYELANNLGGILITTGDYENAEKLLIKSEDLGGNVDYNMGILYIHQGKYAEAVSRLSSYTCDFNLGLAQLLNKDYTAAESTFNCVDPQDGVTYYLLAIDAARQDDKSKTLDFLGKAIDAKPEFKEQAGTDREFLKYYGDADFRALTGLSN
jgi:tetratricopeptide (TPR) repeat protein